MRTSFLTSLLVFSHLSHAPRAHATDGYQTWARMACDADAAVEVEVTLSTPTAADEFRITRILMNTTRKPIRLRPGYALATRRDLEYQVEHTKHGGGLEYKVQKQALEAGHYRMIVLLDFDAASKRWSSLMDGVAWSQVHLAQHPRHSAWKKHIEPMLRERERLARQGKLPALCTALAESPEREREEEAKETAWGL
jgi:hypothetical protein